MAEYGKAAYWEERYTKDPEPFDWYQRYSGIKDILQQHVRKEDAILMVGAGNSRLMEDMNEDGFSNITCIDASKVVADRMHEKFTRERPSLRYHHMSAANLNFPDEAYDAAVDKACLDSILCGEGSTANVAKMCNEISRVLKPHGVYFIVSYGLPENRLPFLEHEEYGWQVSVHTVPKPTINASAVPDTKDASALHYIYVCKKGGNAEEGA